MKRAVQYLARIIAAVFSWRRRKPDVFSTVHSRYPSSIRGTFDYLRSWLAPKWRKFTRVIVVLIGVAVYAGLQLLVSYGIIVDKATLVAGVIFGAVAVILAIVRPLAGLVLWLVVSPVAAGFIKADDISSLPTVTFDDIMLYSLFLTILIRSLVARRGLRSPTIPEWLLILYPVYVLLNAWFKGQVNGINDVRGIMAQVGLWPIVFYITISVVRAKKDLVWIAGAFVVVGVLQSAAMLYEQITGQAYLSVLYGVSIPLKYMGWGDVGVGRSIGLFKSPVVASVFLPMTVCLAMHFSLSVKQHWVKLLCYASAITIVISSYYTFTRNVYVVMVLYLLLMPFFAARQRRQFVILVVTGMLILAALVPVLITNDQFYKRMTNEGNVTLRLNYMKTAANMIRDNFWYGVGLGQYVPNASKYIATFQEGYSSRHYRTRLLAPTFVHNAYLYITCEQGIVGSSLYFGSIVGMLIILLRLHRRADNELPLGKDFVAILIVSVFCLFAQYMSYSNHYATYMNRVMWISFAMGLRYGELCLSERRQRAESKPVSPDNAVPVGV